MAKNYILQFGSGNPTLMAGISPTFLRFTTVPGGASTTFPGITAIPTNPGLFYFTYGPTNSIAFVIDGATTGLTNADRYISGNLDPNDAINEQVSDLGTTLIGYGTTAVALGTTNIALGMTNVALGASSIAQGNTILAGLSGLASGITVIVVGVSGLLDAIGSTASSFGSTSINPGTVFGYLKRLQEWNEGNSEFDKSTSLWDVYSRGSSTLLAEKTLIDSAGIVSKT